MKQDIQTRAMRSAKAFVTFNEWGDKLDMEKLQRVLMRLSKVDILGAGCHGIVIDCGDYVLKFFHADDVAYLAFVDFVLAYGENPYLPRIYSFHKVSKFLYAVTMEKLTTYHGSKKITNRKEYYDDVSRLLDYLYFNCAVKELTRVAKNDLPLFQSLRAYRKNGEENGYGDIYSDIHAGNVMFRRGQIVITDPWC